MNFPILSSLILLPSIGALFLFIHPLPACSTRRCSSNSRRRNCRHRHHPGCRPAPCRLPPRCLPLRSRPPPATGLPPPRSVWPQPCCCSCAFFLCGHISVAKFWPKCWGFPSKLYNWTLNFTTIQLVIPEWLQDKEKDKKEKERKLKTSASSAMNSWSIRASAYCTAAPPTLKWSREPI